MNPKDEYVPTPQEIAEACKRIRAGWTDETHLARRLNVTLEEVRQLRAVRMPTYRITEVGGTVLAEPPASETDPRPREQGDSKKGPRACTKRRGHVPATVTETTLWYQQTPTRTSLCPSTHSPWPTCKSYSATSTRCELRRSTRPTAGRPEIRSSR
jgi:hypothetical protein